LSALSGGFLLAGLYKWVDEKGVTHYSDTPPPKGKAIKVPEPSLPATGGTEATKQKSWKELEQEFRVRQLERERAEREEEAEREAGQIADARRKRECANAHARINFLAGRKIIWRYTAEGKRIYLSDEERSAEIDRLKNFIDTNCRF